EFANLLEPRDIRGRQDRLEFVPALAGVVDADRPHIDGAGRRRKIQCRYRTERQGDRMYQVHSRSVTHRSSDAAQREYCRAGRWRSMAVKDRVKLRATALSQCRTRKVVVSIRSADSRAALIAGDGANARQR